LYSYFEDLFAKDAGTPVVVNVASKAYRALSLTTVRISYILIVSLIPSILQPGEYQAVLKYNGGSETVAHWTVRKPTSRKAKNVIFFIGDGSYYFLNFSFVPLLNIEPNQA